ncbi:Haloacid Dehalogenase Superfamily Class (subfamily) IIA [Schaalia meyeri]|nr:Haloacid Dehalogenase Superfamily Class (subfamily) IIA [Schaalia meyeri]
MIPAGVSADELDAEALRALTTLSGPNRDIVARHLVMAGQLIDLDPEAAYQHAQAAVARAGRVDVVREAAALTAYASGRFEEALREVRAVRRMRGDSSLRAVEADSERGLGHPEKAVDVIEATDASGLELSEQVELVLVSSGARADLGQSDVGLVIVDDALAALPAAADDGLRRRLMEVKADRLTELGRGEEAEEVLEAMPAPVEDTDIIDVALYQDADVDRKRSPLRGSDAALAEEYDCALLDLDGTAWSGDERIEHAAASVVEARQMGMASAFVTNNAMRTPAQVADKLNGMDFAASADMIMTSAMDIAAIMADELEEGSKVFVIGGAGLRLALEERGFVLVDSADDEPAAVVQGLDKQVDWALLSEGAFAIERGAAFFASNLDATLPVERGQALGNGSLVRAITHATRKRPTAGGKPEPGIYRRAGELVGATNPLAVGDRLETDIMGAVAAGVPAMHVLTGVHQARDVIRAPRGQRPSYLAIDMRGLLEAHPAPKHHRDGTWTCGVSQVAKATRSGALTLDDVELTEPVTVSIDSYRALAAAAWEYADGAGTPVPCPDITVVGNDDPTGIVTAPEAVVDASSEESDFFGVAANADDLPEPGAETPAFLPGEEELEELLESTADLDDQD